MFGDRSLSPAGHCGGEVVRDASADRGGKTVGGGRDAERAQSTHGVQKMTAC